LGGNAVPPFQKRGKKSAFGKKARKKAGPPLAEITPPKEGAKTVVEKKEKGERSGQRKNCGQKKKREEKRPPLFLRRGGKGKRIPKGGEGRGDPFFLECARC